MGVQVVVILCSLVHLVCVDSSAINVHNTEKFIIGQNEGNTQEFIRQNEENTQEFLRQNEGNTQEFIRQNEENTQEFIRQNEGNTQEFIRQNEGNTQEFIRQNEGYEGRSQDHGEKWIPSTSSESNVTNYHFVSGIVSVACLRCLCLWRSDCLPAKCDLQPSGRVSCGYFQISNAYWVDCGKPGVDFHQCARNIKCASKCVQRYMAKYIEHSHCPLQCESYVREHVGGPSGCNNPLTVPYWNQVQTIPGCKGVQ